MKIYKITTIIFTALTIAGYSSQDGVLSDDVNSNNSSV